MPHIADKIAEALHMKHHKEEAHTAATDAAPAAETSNPEAAKTTPVFDASKITVLFVLGGPGAGG